MSRTLTCAVTGLLAVLMLAPSSSAAGRSKRGLDRRSRRQIKACHAGESLSCRSLAERYQAGLVGDNSDMAPLLREAAKYFRKACALRRRTACPSAERVEARLAELEASRAERGTPAEMERWIKQCEQSLDRARTAGPQHAFAPISSACKRLYVEGCAKTLAAVASTSGSSRTQMVAHGCGEAYCPKLKGKGLAACRGKKPARLTAKQASLALKDLNRRILELELGRDRAKSVISKFDAVWTSLFP